MIDGWRGNQKGGVALGFERLCGCGVSVDDEKFSPGGEKKTSSG